MELKFQVQAKINKPRNEVFDAVYNPRQLSRYFTTGGSSGPLVAGTTVIWKFADYPVDVPIVVKEVTPNESIVFEWDAADHEEAVGKMEALGYKTRVEIKFESLSATSTLVRIWESGWRETQGGLNGSYMNCQGWMNMACCMKAYLEHAINLREGFF